MSFNKAPFQAIVDGLCLRADITPEVAEQFVTTFFDIIRENLRLDKIVKVRGLGTFKMVDVEARESVKVGTGERYVIDGHSKVSFTPDPVLRDAVNRPFADFDTVFLNDGVDLAKMEEISAEATALPDEPLSDETVDEPLADDVPMALLSDVEQPVAEEPTVDEPQAEPEPVEEEPMVTVDEPVAVQEEQIVEDVQATEDEPAASEESYNEEEEASPETPVTPFVDHQYKHSHSGHRKSRGGIFWNVLGAIALLAVGYLLGYYVHPFQLPDFKRTTSNDVKMLSAEPLDSAEVIEAVETEDSLAAAEPTEQAEQTLQPAAAQTYPQLEGGDYEIVGVEGTEVMCPGKTLLNISIKYYGSKDFVKYICLMNGIKNPDIVPLDKELQIPTLRKVEN